jgi:aldose 1-epimerase
MSQAAIEKDVFGRTADGVAVDRYTLRNARGALARIINFGATVTELWMPDLQGKLADVVLGYDDLAPYTVLGPYFGCIVGRVAFRIAGAEFVLDGKQYRLTQNNPPHHMHGGVRGFSKTVWQAEPISSSLGPAVKFVYNSPDGDEGYPGNLDTTVVYTLTEDNQLQVDCTAVTDQPTLINLTHHSYFNLAGAGSGDVLRHVLHLDADRWILADEPDLPSGEIRQVAGTPFDFRQSTPIGKRIAQTGGDPLGYDLCYLHSHPDGKLARVATLSEPLSGRKVEVSTNEPAIVLYTANYLDGSLRGKGGVVYQKHAGVCLETGRPPDAVHHPQFPSTILRPGETYRHTCVYQFSVEC